MTASSTSASGATEGAAGRQFERSIIVTTPRISTQRRMRAELPRRRPPTRTGKQPGENAKKQSMGFIAGAGSHLSSFLRAT